MSVLLVNPPTFAVKPPLDSRFRGFFAALTNQHPPINTGLMTIASDIYSYDQSVEIIDGVSQSDYQSRIERKVQEGVDIVGVGCPSAYEYLESMQIAELVKRTNPNTKVIFGGQHIAPLGKLVFEHSPYVDAVGIMPGEAIFREIYNQGSIDNIPGLITKDNPDAAIIGAKVLKLDDLGPLRHELFPNFRSYTPYVEDSRGCPYRCCYCNNDILFGGRIDKRGLKSFETDLKHVVDLYGKDELFAVLASYFGVNVQNTLEKTKLIKGFDIKWMTELRMDAPWERYLDELYDSGLRILTSGMESANPTILKRMQKTRNPERYIRKASELSKKVEQYPDLVFKLSYMIYMGESFETLQDTLDFISDHRDGIDSVLLTPTFVIEGTKLRNQLRDPDFVAETGFRFIPDEYWNSRGVFFGDLSPEISYDKAAELSQRIETDFSNDRAMELYEEAHSSRMHEEGTKDLWKDRFDMGDAPE